jgi:hypothetical protein
MAVEYSFNQITKFPHTDDSRRHRITQSRWLNWQFSRCLWDLQMFFFNLFTCGMGSRVTALLGVNPPTVHDYLYSVNHNLLIDVPVDPAKDEFQEINAYYI